MIPCKRWLNFGFSCQSLRYGICTLLITARFQFLVAWLPSIYLAPLLFYDFLQSMAARRLRALLLLEAFHLENSIVSTSLSSRFLSIAALKQPKDSMFILGKLRRWCLFETSIMMELTHRCFLFTLEKLFDTELPVRYIVLKQ